MQEREKINVAVFGDLLLDRYWYTDITQISPEAPIPVAKVYEIKDSLGGAGNVFQNVSSICRNGFEDFSYAYVGKCSEKLLDISRDLWKHYRGNTYQQLPSIKNRIVVKEPFQQIIRFDEDCELHYESRGDDGDQETDLIEVISNLDINVAIVSDYGKGAITPEIFRAIRASAQTVLVDPKERLLMYEGAKYICPNLKELVSLGGLKAIQGALPKTSIIVKRGRKGASLFPVGEKKEIEFRSVRTERPVIDPTGAGDTFIAALAVCLAWDWSPYAATAIANHLAGISVTYPQCYIPTEEDFQTAKEAIFNEVKDVE